MHKYSTHQCRCWAISFCLKIMNFLHNFSLEKLWNCHNKVKDLWWIFCRSGFLFEDMLGRHQRKSSIEPFKFLLVLKYSSVYSFRFFKKEVALHIHHLKSGYSCNIRKWPYPEPFPRIIRVWRKKQYISYSSFSFEKKMYVCGTQKRNRINQLVVYSLFDKTS